MLASCGGGAPTSGELRTLDLEAAIDNPREFDLSEIAQKTKDNAEMASFIAKYIK